MHLFPDEFGCHEASHLYNRRMRRGSELVLKSLVWRRASDGSLQITKPTLWGHDEPMQVHIDTCKKMGHEPLYCVTLKRIAEHR